jgi:electron transfer flavoprotein alpha subunit
VVLASGTDVGNEVLAYVAALADQPFAANCTAVSLDAGGGGELGGAGGGGVDVGRAVGGGDEGRAPRSASVVRQRWGGSLVEEARLVGDPLVVSVAPHAVAASPAPVPTHIVAVDVDLPAQAARSIVVDRVERSAGLTLATAPVVVGGGRGVGSADGFAALEELAGELGGVVGCSRAVTNNGWRNHADQVGQTGTRISPELYIACGISGAVQHWVGAMASKRILAVNTDPDANMVTKADYAVIGDLHEVVPAITAEIRRRRTGS